MIKAHDQHQQVKRRYLLFVPRDFLDGPAPAWRDITNILTLSNLMKELRCDWEYSKAPIPAYESQWTWIALIRKQRCTYDIAFLPQDLLPPSPPWNVLHCNPTISFQNTPFACKEVTHEMYNWPTRRQGKTTLLLFAVCTHTNLKISWRVSCTHTSTHTHTHQKTRQTNSISKTQQNPPNDELHPRKAPKRMIRECKQAPVETCWWHAP